MKSSPNMDCARRASSSLQSASRARARRKHNCRRSISSTPRGPHGREHRPHDPGQCRIKAVKSRSAAKPTRLSNTISMPWRRTDRRQELRYGRKFGSPEREAARSPSLRCCSSWEPTTRICRARGAVSRIVGSEIVLQRTDLAKMLPSDRGIVPRRIADQQALHRGC